MKCEKCGKEIDRVSISKFMWDGSDNEDIVYIDEDEYGSVMFETDSNWCGYELSEEEMMEGIRCIHCDEFPFKHKEVQVYDVVRVVCFKEEERMKGE